MPILRDCCFPPTAAGTPTRQSASRRSWTLSTIPIEFGAFYLAAQIREAGGSVYQGLAAYNGGGSNAARWRRAAGSAAEVDRFVEAIDFRETEAYIRLVMENYAWYRFLYGAAERPSLVR